MNKKQRGQFFTTNDTVQKVLTGLLLNTGELLEPSAGEGHLVSAVEETGKFNITAWELDDSLNKNCETMISYGNFFSYADKHVEHFDSILSNPLLLLIKKLNLLLNSLLKTLNNIIMIKQICIICLLTGVKTFLL